MDRINTNGLVTITNSQCPLFSLSVCDSRFGHCRTTFIGSLHLHVSCFSFLQTWFVVILLPPFFESSPPLSTTRLGSGVGDRYCEWQFRFIVTVGYDPNGLCAGLKCLLLSVSSYNSFVLTAVTYRPRSSRDVPNTVLHVDDDVNTRFQHKRQVPRRDQVPIDVVYLWLDQLGFLMFEKWSLMVKQQVDGVRAPQLRFCVWVNR